MKWVDKILDVRRNVNFYQSLKEAEQQYQSQGTIQNVAKFTSKLKAVSKPKRSPSLAMSVSRTSPQSPAVKIEPPEPLQADLEKLASNTRKNSVSLSAASVESTRVLQAVSTPKQENSKRDFLEASVWKQERRNSAGSYSSKKKPARVVNHQMNIDAFSLAVQQAAQVQKGFVEIDSERFAKLMLQHKTKQALMKVKHKLKSDWMNLKKYNTDDDGSTQKNGSLGIPFPMIASKLQKELAETITNPLKNPNSSLNRLSPVKNAMGGGFAAIASKIMNEHKSTDPSKLKEQGFLVKSKKFKDKAARRLKESQIALFKNDVKAEVSRHLLSLQEKESSQQWLTQEAVFAKEFYLPEHYQELLLLLGKQASHKPRNQHKHEPSHVTAPPTQPIKERFMELLKSHLENDFPECAGGVPYLLGEGHLLNKQRAELLFDGQDSSVRGNPYHMEEPELMSIGASHKLIILEGVRRKLLEIYSGGAGDRELLGELDQYIQDCYL